jgi:hypothetical protein
MALVFFFDGITVSAGILKYDVRGRWRLCAAVVMLGACLMFIGGLWL